MRELSSVSHPEVKRLVRLRTDRAERYAGRSVLIEGRKLVAEVCRDKPARVIMATDESLVPSGVRAQEAYLVTAPILEKVAGAQHPEGIVAEVDMPPLEAGGRFDALQWVVVLDRIADPGNMGTLLRTALALGWQGALLVEGCCDPFNDKALRAAKGATFRLPIAACSAEWLLRGERPLIAADLSGPAPAPHKASWLVLGSEAHGIDKRFTQGAELVSIPMSGAMESLNVAVAGAILMYALRGTDGP